MHILITNDDGITAPGLAALAQEMRKLGKVTVLAPDKNWSASGHVKTLHRPLRIVQTNLADGTSGFAADGAPSDCVALALLGFIREKIDLVVSGINPNANMGHDVTYSGTVTAAMEAVIFGVPAIAFSLDAAEYHRGQLDFTKAAQIACAIARQSVEQGIPDGILLNVNIPYITDQIPHGILITRQGKRIYRDELVQRKDPHGRSYYWIGGEAPSGVPEEGTDIGALASGYISITPLHLDLTAHQVMDDLRQVEWEPFIV
ncbi:MAG: 5'/3'-nucleotidase SurE [Chloroflexota bacterium]|jgi:5'-nucleotidase